MKKVALFSTVFAGLQSMAAAQQEIITEDAAVVILVCIIIIFVLVSVTLLCGLMLVLCKGACHRGKVCPLTTMDTTKKKRGKEFSELPGRQDLQQYAQKTTPKLTIMSRDLSGTEMISYDHGKRSYGLSAIPESTTVISNLGAEDLDRGPSGSFPGTPAENEDDVELTEI